MAKSKSNRIIPTPSHYAKEHYLYVQEVGTLQSLEPHISKRQNLNSFRRQLKEEILWQYSGMGRGRKVLYLLLFLLAAYGTSQGIKAYIFPLIV